MNEPEFFDVKAIQKKRDRLRAQTLLTYNHSMIDSIDPVRDLFLLEKLKRGKLKVRNQNNRNKEKDRLYYMKNRKKIITRTTLARKKRLEANPNYYKDEYVRIKEWETVRKRLQRWKKREEKMSSGSMGGLLIF